MITKDKPIILVFYLDRELMANREIMGPFAEMIDKQLSMREANAMAFFLPTDGEERVECINPVQLEKPDMDKIYKIVGDLEKNFDVGQGADEGKDDPANEREVEPRDEE